MSKITPFLWFDTQAEEAALFYTSIFPDSGIDDISRYGEGSPGPAGTVMVVSFHLGKQRYLALNGGPVYEMNPSISFMVHCETQEEVDRFWEKLTADGGEEVQCGWLKDKFGVTWQITPTALMEWIRDEDEAAAKRTMQAMMEMKKLDIAALRRAHDGD